MPLTIPPWPRQTPEIAMAVSRCIESADWGRYQSQTKNTLITALESFFETDHVRLCCSGTAAIEISLRAAGVTTGDEVIVSAFDYPGNFRCIELLGAKPVLVDVASENFGPDVDSVSAAANKQVRAVIASHLYGHACDIASLRDLCDQQGWVLIEDACQAPGMRVSGKPAGSFGHLATLSFGGSKPLSSGNGGAILTDDGRLAARIAGLLDRPSEAFPLSALQASVLVPQLAELENHNAHRNRIAWQIQQQLLRMDSPLQCLAETRDGVDPAYYKLALRAASPAIRNQVVATAAEHNVPIGHGFRSMARSSERRCRKPVSLDRSEALANEICVLDHRALLIDEADVLELCQLIGMS
ncbi:pleiotropic regulatory protein [Rhodopirellula maiorica SM1]|uniref:Pleiotropic regulatory protein n=1 Tax=Rhodopirellula maiorica SM1 TaxID=1265738 RepID=M5RHP3_9BACT|nr:aminotransferase class I/II-fold pyridoxal phosphate-dependent enzyme [Rhodopirellula maiorica]EMI18721.1 pleiotropic regulatory protein [Rhodopirellula maiorica SM1]